MRGLAVLAAASMLAGACGDKKHADVVIGVTTTSVEAPGPTVVPEPVEPAAAAGAGAPRDPRLLLDANGRPYGSPLVFRSNVPVPGDLVFVLIVGSDARPGQNLRKSNADSLHLMAVNPRTMQGTLVGIPRDAWVEIPGKGNGKITSALPNGGPDLLVRTVEHLTGLPVHYWVLTGFAGLTKMVDELGGVDVHVSQRMNDRDSGAHFQPGWHHFNGAQALAFSRNRHDVPNGDFGRSFNQGALMLAALSKLRAEVDDDEGLRRWLDVLSRHAELDAPASSLLGLAALARRLDPAALANVVVPGRVGTTGGQSVVFLGQEAAEMFLDLRPDAVLGRAGPEVTTTTSSTTTSTTSTSTSTTTSSTIPL
jgi:polyisoprenyl-teichoic acid--peptidoglycan teichoic acid transferase